VSTLPQTPAESGAPDGSPHVSRQTLTDFAVDEIRKKIVLGILAPGEKLRVDALVTELAVSRVPVREAFRELLAEGLVEIFPRRGAVVAEIRRDDVDDGYRTLELMEVMAAERLVAAGSADTAERMRSHLHELEQLAADPDPLRFLLTHRAFHFEVFDALGVGMLPRTARMLWHACERYISTSARGDRLTQAHQEHAELVRYLAAGDAIAAVATVRMHVAHGRQAALRGLGFA